MVRINGTITSGNNGVRLAGAIVAFGIGGSPQLAVQSNLLGSYFLKVAISREACPDIWVQVEAAGHATSSRRPVACTENSQTIDISLTPNSTGSIGSIGSIGSRGSRVRFSVPVG